MQRNVLLENLVRNFELAEVLYINLFYMLLIKQNSDVEDSSREVSGFVWLLNSSVWNA